MLNSGSDNKNQETRFWKKKSFFIKFHNFKSINRFTFCQSEILLLFLMIGNHD